MQSGCSWKMKKVSHESRKKAIISACWWQGAANPSRRNRRGKLYIVGIGPGATEHLTRKAENALLESEYIIGNGTYLDQIAEL